MDTPTSVGPGPDFYVRNLLNLFILKFSWSPRLPNNEHPPRFASLAFEWILLIGPMAFQL
jgi:hypothetical protein